AAARSAVADQLRAAAARTPLPDEVVERLHRASELLGEDVVGDTGTTARPDIAEVLVPGARICFTGTAIDGAGRVVDRDEIERMAQDAGLQPVRTVTKTRCEVLVVAEAGTQSGKAR